MNQSARYFTKAFTLIELSIVLVGIGLLVGGVLVGKDLIWASNVRQQISQLDQYKAAAATFRLKYNCLPGDCKNAGQFGFKVRGPNPGQGDGNGIIQSRAGVVNADVGAWGEPAMFWVDLSSAGFIAEKFTIGVPGGGPDAALDIAQYGTGGYLYNAPTDTVPRWIGDILPVAKLIGNKNFVVATSGGYWAQPWSDLRSDGKNYFFIQNIITMGRNWNRSRILGE